MLGPAYQWTTEIYADGELKNGTLNGNLWIKGGGDPYLPIERVWLLIHRLQTNGLHTIKGDLGLVNFSPLIPLLQHGEDLLDYFHVAKDRKVVCLFESRRQDLDLQLSLILYEILRLESYLKNITTLSAIRKCTG